MKQLVNSPDGYATNLAGRKGTNLTLVNQGGSSAVAAAAATEAGNVVTIVPTNPIPNLQAGQAIQINGIVPSGYNGSFIITSVAANGNFTYFNPVSGLGASTVAGTATQGCDVYFDTSAVSSRLNTSKPSGVVAGNNVPGDVPDGTKIAAGGGQVQFTNAPIIWLRAAVQTTIEVQP